MWQYTYSDELYHYGVLGMKWGKHIFGKDDSSTGRKRSSNKKPSLYEKRMNQVYGKIRAKDRQWLIEDANRINLSAKPTYDGKPHTITGKYSSNYGSMTNPSTHVVNGKGKVKLSVMTGRGGPVAIAASRKYVEQNGLLKLLRNMNGVRIEYGVYDDD